MANTLLTSDMIAKEALMQFKNSLGFTKGANRQYNDKFAVSGAKIGNKIDIRKPQRFQVTDGATVSKQDVVNEVVSLTLDSRKHVAFQFSSQELTLDIDRFSETYVAPADHALANKVDIDGLAKAAVVANAVGTPGTTPSSLSIAGQARAKLNQYAAPSNGRSIILGSDEMTGLVDGAQALFNPTKEIARQYEDGFIGRARGFDWRESENIKLHTVGAQGGTPVVNGASQTGSSLNTDGWTASVTGLLKEGDVFTIADVYAVNPVSFQSTGKLQQFVVTSDVNSDGSGEASLGIYPAIITSGATQTVSAAPVDNAAITVLGSSGAITTLGLAYHKDAFIFGCADLEMPKNVDMAARAVDKESGLSIRFVRYYDGDEDQLISRLDVLYGWLAARPEWACRVQG